MKKTDKYGNIIYTNKIGQYHREDGPAIEYFNGNKCWYINDQLHREDGPAIEYTNGDKVWYINGQPHREDGPACEYFNGEKYWWINGKRIDCKSQEEFERLLKIGKAFW